jgi:hypothetical protein
MKITAERIIPLAKEAEAEGQLWECAVLKALATALTAGEEEIEHLGLAAYVYAKRAKPRLEGMLAAKRAAQGN